jgi:hypothetical protein
MSYGKKLGLPGYSSHNFSVSLKSEVANLEDIPEEVERVYRSLQTSVDEQIVNPGFVPGESETVPAAETNGNGWRCSEKQKDLILKLSLDRNDVDLLAVERFGHGVRELNKLEASGLIEELLEQTGSSKRRGRPNTRRAA